MKGPGPFFGIGKRAQDLLNKDFNYDQKFTISTTTASGIVFNTNLIKKGDAFLNEVVANIHQNGVKTEIKVDSKSKVTGVMTFDTPVQGMKCVISGNLPDQKSAKAEASYATDHAHITSSFGLNAQPLLHSSIVLGVDRVTVGGEVAYDTATSSLTKYNAGIGVIYEDFSAALILADKADTLKASYHQTINPSSAIAVEVAHKISKNDITFTAGASIKLDPLTTSKVRLNNRGTISALLQHEWRPKSFITFSGEVDSKALDQSAKVGVAVQLKP